MVRHRLLVPTFGGSNPSSPAKKIDLSFDGSFFLISDAARTPGFVEQNDEGFGGVNEVSEMVPFPSE